VRTWPYEALVTAIDRGLVPDWKPIFTEIRRSPWGPVARRVERYLAYRGSDGVSVVFSEAITRARAAIEQQDRAEVAARVRSAVTRSGLTSGQFAELVGTSASRLSTYASGSVTPSAAMLARIERTSEETARERTQSRTTTSGTR
jgi:DNA-binding transcriptional regulator YiaG